MWDDRIEALKQEITASKVLSSRQIGDLHTNVDVFLIAVKNVPDTLSQNETEVIVQLFEKVIHETVVNDRTPARATAARRELLKAIHDKEEQAETLSETLYDMAQILASMGV